MKFVLTPKYHEYYGLKADSMISPVYKATLWYNLNDKFYDEYEMKKYNEKYTVSLKNGTKFSVHNKEEFITKLEISHKEVSTNNMNSNFEIRNN